MLAVDAGTHMAAITRILAQELPLIHKGGQRADSDGHIFPQEISTTDLQEPPSSPSSSPPAREKTPAEPIYVHSGPFANVALPHASARANAAHIVRNIVATYLITHPHLDHLSGFAINTAAFHATSRPKRLAALPFTVDAIKKHIFNDIIWPNLTDEDGGVGFVSFQRLKEGGDVMVGEGAGRGYIEVCEGLGAKGFKISHGKCMRSNASADSHRGSLGNVFEHMESHIGTPRHGIPGRNISLGHLQMPDTPGVTHSPQVVQGPAHGFGGESNSVDSTAYFIRDTTTSREILIFGDVEPDSVSMTPRLGRVWAEAAAKIAAGLLKGIFIECSYDDSQGDAVLFGHLAPRHLIAELQILAGKVKEEKSLRASEKAMRKRKRAAASGMVSPSIQVEESSERKRTRSLARQFSDGDMRRSSLGNDGYLSGTPTPTAMTSAPVQEAEMDYLRAKTISFSQDKVGEEPLKGLRVIVIHVKDTLKDGPHVSESILSQLQLHALDLEERGIRLGCEFVISESGQDYWF